MAKTFDFWSLPSWNEMLFLTLYGRVAFLMSTFIRAEKIPVYMRLYSATGSCRALGPQVAYVSPSLATGVAVVLLVFKTCVPTINGGGTRPCVIAHGDLSHSLSF